MKNKLKQFYSAITAVSIIAGFMAGSVSPVYAQNPNLSVIPPSVMPYKEWSAKWWQWNLSLPLDQNPSYDGSVSDPPDPRVDKPGECPNGANGQRGPVWFLTGVINNSGLAVRNCKVPAGKVLFFPIINVECSTLEVGTQWYGGNREELRACVGNFNMGELSAEIDGVKVPNLDLYLVESPMFPFKVPQNNVLGVAAGTGRSVSKGYYLMLAPLSVGQHTINFGGSFTDGSFALYISYVLNVVPEKP